jgi:hypothetical protein
MVLQALKISWVGIQGREVQILSAIVNSFGMADSVTALQGSEEKCRFHLLS